jgi:hypothetical protein
LVSHGHDCETVQEAGWSGKQNGELLKLAASEFDALATLDTNLRYQQNLIGQKIAIVVLRARSNRIEDLRPLFPECLQALETVRPGDIVQLP